MVSGPDIVFRVEGALGRVTLNRPQTLNALTSEMCAGLYDELRTWADDTKIAAVAIDAVPGRAFCAGGDIRIVSEWAKRGDPRALAFFATEYRLNALIAHFPKPYVALVDGIVMGGGAGISVHGSHRVVTENAVFAMPETNIGFFADVGGSYFLSHMPGEIGTYLGLTGTRVNAADMIYAGAATHFVSSTELSAVTGRLAAGESADTVLQSLKQDVGVAPIAQYRESIDTAFSAESVEGIISRLNRAGTFGAGAERILSKCSPTSLKLVLRQVREGRARDLDDCLRMEFRIVAQILKGPDFFEGVRAVLIDKDNAPRWRPPRLDLVSDAEIEAFFAPCLATLEL